MLILGRILLCIAILVGFVFGGWLLLLMLDWGTESVGRPENPPKAPFLVERKPIRNFPQKSD